MCGRREEEMRGDERRTSHAELVGRWGSVHQILSLLVGGLIGYECSFWSRMNRSLCSYFFLFCYSMSVVRHKNSIRYPVPRMQSKCYVVVAGRGGDAERLAD